MERYLKVTEGFRGNCDQLVITTIPPYRKASRDTLSRWIRALLTKCGVGKEYAPHNLRHASTSAALKKGIDMSVIKSLAGWSEQSKTFNHFYNRPIVKSKEDFARAVILQENVS